MIDAINKMTRDELVDFALGVCHAATPLLKKDFVSFMKEVWKYKKGVYADGFDLVYHSFLIGEEISQTGVTKWVNQHQ